MNPQLGLTGLPLRQRSNRLRRSCRAAQRAAGPGSDLTQPPGPDLRTPTRSSAVFSGESPHNDSDLQQDIIWDATSPSPNRLSKRGRRPPGGVDISEIVSRIAPERGRPEVTEPTLQQWIGDSATIPCTPDVHVPKKKSPRSNGVDELLKLAKQFDFNMFHQDEEEVEDMHQHSLELLSEDILDFEDDDQEVGVSCGPPGTDADVLVDLHSENDLDLLFDGPTQRGGLSQVSFSGKSAISTTNDNSGTACDEFDDDWDNDDLLVDSLVLETTQNPERFTGPIHSSTPASDTSAVCEVEKEKVRQRTTFKLESNPNFSERTIHTWTNSKPAGGDTGSRFLGFRSQSPWSDQRTSVLDAVLTTTHSLPSSLVEPTLVPDVLEEDLDVFFSAEPVWDDGADDDLLCEMCEDLENQIRSSDNVPAERTPLIRPTSNRRAALQPSIRAWDNWSPQPANQQPVLQKETGGQVTVGKDAFRYTQTKGISRSISPSTAACSRVQVVVAAAAAAHSANKEQFTFKKPNNPASTAADKVVGKCSAAEIELKKLRAMEKRRQRLKAAQNLGAPTSQLQLNTVSAALRR